VFRGEGEVFAVFRSSVGRKAIMAVTGLGLVVYVVAHMLGNLQIYLGRDVINSYAQMLKGAPVLLWTARIGLAALFVAHIYLGVTLYAENRAARPVRYVRYEPRAATISSRTMLISGLVILAFVVYHLLHFTVGTVLPENFQRREAIAGGADRHDVYAMVVLGFRQPAVAASYVIAQLFLGLHLYHAVPSLFQSLGLKHPRYNALIDKLGLGITLAVVLGNVSIPLSIWLGLVGTSV
jgi:succinate dehydrogenase / fumarate reductase cytochrome b subunit